MSYSVGILYKNVSEGDHLQSALKKSFTDASVEAFLLPEGIIASHSKQRFSAIIVSGDQSATEFITSYSMETPVIAVVRNITDGKKALSAGAHDFVLEEEIHPSVFRKSIQLAIERRTSEQNYEALFYDAPAPMWAFDPETLKIEVVNKAAIQHYGFSNDEFTQMRITELRPAEDIPKLLSTCDSLKRLSKPFSNYKGEWRHRKKDGEIITVELQCQLVKRNQRAFCLVAIQDITEKKKNFERIKEQEERLRHHIIGSRMFSVDINYKTREVIVSDEACEILGNEVKNHKSIDDLIKSVHPDDRERVVSSLRSFNPGTTIPKTQFRVFDPHGKVLWLERHPYLYYDDNNEPLGTKGLIVDITDQKQKELELINSYGELQRAATQQASILNALPAHIALLNSEGIIVAINDRWRTFADDNVLASPNYGIGMSYFTAHEDDEIKVVHDALKEVLTGRCPSFRHEYPCHAPNKQRWFTMIAARLDEGGGAVIMHLDITDRKIAEIEFQKAQANLMAIFDTTEDAFIMIGSDYKIMAFNRQAEVNAQAFFGQRYEQGVSFLNYVDSDLQNIFIEKLGDVAVGHDMDFETSFGSHENTQWFRIKVRAVQAADKSLLGYCISGHNFTEQKQTELKLRASEERFRSLIENSGDLFTIATLEGFITYASPNIAAVFGHLEIDRLCFHDLVHPEEAEGYGAMFKKVCETPGRIFHHINRIKDLAGQWRWIEGSIVNLTHLESVNGIVANFRDITSRIKTELELKRSEYFLEKATATARLGYWTLRLDDLSVRWSKQMFQILGLNEQESRPSVDLFYSVVHPEDVELVKQKVETLFQTKVPGSFICRAVRADKKICWISVDAEFTYDDSGAALLMLGIAQDITELKGHEERLRINNNNLASIINSSHDLIWAVNSKGKLTHANQAYQNRTYELFGFEQAIGEDVIVDPTDLGKFWNDKYTLTLEGNFLEFEYSLPNDQRLYEVRLNPIFDNKEVIGLSGYCRDITEAKKQQEVIRKINAQYDILSRATNDAVWDWNMQTNELRWNHGLEHLFGHSYEEQEQSLDWWDSNVHEDDRIRIKSSLDQAIAEKKNNWNGSYRFRCADGNYKYVFDRAYVVYQDDAAVRMIGAIQDIDELTHYRKSLEQKVEERTKELHASLAKEKELAEMKSRFVSIASHEFRTPLATIEFATGFLKSYRHRVSDDDIEKKLNQIDKQVKHMASLLEDVLVVGKTEVGKINVQPSAVNLRDLVNEVCESVERLSNSSHTIEIFWGAASSHYITDEKLLRNVLSNLLTNAIKFSPGAAKVFLACREDEEQITFSIMDNGIGIPDKDLNNIFEAFTRGSNAGTIPGTGLGLSIVKRTVDLLQGSIAVNSRPGETMFTVTLPKAVQHEKD